MRFQMLIPCGDLRRSRMTARRWGRPKIARREPGGNSALRGDPGRTLLRNQRPGEHSRSLPQLQRSSSIALLGVTHDSLTFGSAMCRGKPSRSPIVRVKGGWMKRSWPFIGMLLTALSIGCQSDKVLTDPDREGAALDPATSTSE